MNNIMSRTLSVHQEHELLLRLEAAGLDERLARKIVTSKDNELARSIVEFALNRVSQLEFSAVKTSETVDGVTFRVKVLRRPPVVDMEQEDEFDFIFFKVTAIEGDVDPVKDARVKRGLVQDVYVQGRINAMFPEFADKYANGDFYMAGDNFCWEGTTSFKNKVSLHMGGCPKDILFDGIWYGGRKL